jgi:hypothetical protein
VGKVAKGAASAKIRLFHILKQRFYFKLLNNGFGTSSFVFPHSHRQQSEPREVCEKFGPDVQKETSSPPVRCVPSPA